MNGRMSVNVTTAMTSGFNNAELSGIYQELGCWYLLSDWPPEEDPTDPWRGMLGVMYVNPHMWIFTQSNAHTYI